MCVCIFNSYICTSSTASPFGVRQCICPFMARATHSSHLKRNRWWGSHLLSKACCEGRQSCAIRGEICTRTSSRRGRHPASSRSHRVAESCTHFEGLLAPNTATQAMDRTLHSVSSSSWTKGVAQRGGQKIRHPPPNLLQFRNSSPVSFSPIILAEVTTIKIFGMAVIGLTKLKVPGER